MKLYLIVLIIGIVIGVYVTPVKTETVTDFKLINNTLYKVNGTVCEKYLQHNITVINDYYKTIKVYENMTKSSIKCITNLKAGKCPTSGCANGYYMAKYDGMECFNLDPPKYSERPGSGYEELLNKTKAPCLLADIVNNEPVYRLNASTWFIVRDNPNPFYGTRWTYKDFLDDLLWLNLTYDKKLNKTLKNQTWFNMTESTWIRLSNRSLGRTDDFIELMQYER